MWTNGVGVTENQRLTCGNPKLVPPRTICIVRKSSLNGAITFRIDGFSVTNPRIRGRARSGKSGSVYLSDDVTPMVPVGATSGPSRSTTRRALSVLVTMTSVNMSVGTSPIGRSPRVMAAPAGPDRRLPAALVGAGRTAQRRALVHPRRPRPPARDRRAARRDLPGGAGARPHGRRTGLPGHRHHDTARPRRHLGGLTARQVSPGRTPARRPGSSADASTRRRRARLPRSCATRCAARWGRTTAGAAARTDSP